MNNNAEKTKSNELTLAEAMTALTEAQAEIAKLKELATVAVRQSGNIRSARSSGKARRVARLNELLSEGNRTRAELVAELMALETGVSESTVRTEITDSSNAIYAAAGLIHLTRRVGEVVGFVDSEGKPLFPFPADVRRGTPSVAASLTKAAEELSNNNNNNNNNK